MNGDISAYLFDPRQAYSSVRLQQGRVITDLDWNENERIEADEQLRLLADLCAATARPTTASACSGPQPATVNVPAAATAVVQRDTYDVRLSAGIFLLGGHLHLWPRRPAGRHRAADVPATRTTGCQLGGQRRRRPARRPPADRARVDLVYLDAFEHPVRAVEDRELRERALGGPGHHDAAQAVRRVHVLPAAGDDLRRGRSGAARPRSPGRPTGDTSGVRARVRRDAAASCCPRRG